MEGETKRTRKKAIARLIIRLVTIIIIRAVVGMGELVEDKFSPNITYSAVSSSII